MLWLLERIGKTGYDEYAGMVVRAESEAQARQIASGGGSPVFLDEGLFTCKWIGDDGEPEIILVDFHAG